MKKIIFTGLMLIFLVTTVQAITDEGLIIYYSFDNSSTSGTTMIDSLNQNNGTLTNGVQGAPGLIGQKIVLDGTGDYVQSNADPDSMTGNVDFSINIWFMNDRDSSYATDYALTGVGDDNSACALSYVIFDTPDDELFGHLRGGCGSGDWDTAFPVPFNDGDWHMLTFTHNKTNNIYKLYLNGTLLGNYNLGASINLNAEPWNIGLHPNYVSSFNDWDGSIDEASLWNITLTDQNVTDLWNSGSGLAYPFTVSTDPTLSLSTDLVSYVNDTSNPYIFNFSGTVAYTSDIFNCSMYLNSTLNDTILDINITNTQSFNLTYGGQQTGYDVNVTCSNINVTNSFIKYDVFLDSVLPELEIISSFLNNSVLYYDRDTINFNTSFSDNNLYALNISIIWYNSTTQELMNNTFIDGINGTFYQYNISGLDFTSWQNGTYRIDVEAWDSHTANKIKPVSWYTSPDIIVMDNDIELYGSIKEDKTSFVMSEDETKMKFKITWDDDSLNHQLEIRTYDNPLRFIPGSDYKGHFVYWGNNQRWIDFEGGNVKDVDVTQVSEDRYLLDIELWEASDEIEFESIGDLNYNNLTSYFTVTEGMSFFAKDVFTNTTINEFTILVYNGSTLLGNETTTTGQVVFNITSGNYTTNFTSPTHADNSTEELTFSNYGNFTYYVFASNSLYLFIYDEQTNTLIDDQNVTLYVINYDNESTEVDTSSGSTFVSGFTPGIYELRYGSSDYNTRSYYTTITASSTQEIDLYLLNSTDANYISFINQDETGNLYEGGYFKMYRHFTDCNCFKVVEMDLTNFNGIAVISAEKYEGKYRFIVEYNNETVYSSTAEEGYKLTADSYTITWTLLGDTTESWFGTSGLYYNLSWSNASKSFYLTVNDPSVLVDEFCLYVDELDALTSQGYTRRCESCLSSNSGVVSCNMSSYIDNGHELLAKGWIHTNTEFSEYWLTPISALTDLSAVVSLGTLGVFLGFILILTVFFAGLVVAGLPGAIMFFIVSLIVVTALKLIVLSLPVLIGVIAVAVIVLVLVGDK